MEATLSRIINWEIQNTAKLAEQIIQDKTKYKKRKLAETNGRKSDLVRRPLGQELNPEVFCEALGQVAHSVESCLNQRSDPIITESVMMCDVTQMQCLTLLENQRGQ